MPPCVRAHASLCSSSAARPHYSLTYFLTYFRTYFLTYLPYLTTYLIRAMAGAPRALLGLPPRHALHRGRPPRAAPHGLGHLTPHGHSPACPQPPRPASPERRCLTLPHSAAHVASPPPPHAHSRLVPPTPRVPHTGGPDLSLTSAWWVELCCCPGASRPPWLPLSTQAPDQLGVP